MPEQLTLPPEKPVEGLGFCAWCGKQAVTEIEIEPARWTTKWNPIERKSIRIMRKRPIMAPVCSYHDKHLKRRDDE